ncbi:MAG: phytanoyl-CoA dioxygenase family protein [Chloroflexi bacterium]|nr:phytanoyl-CoA dioxygenase family protein [Chloroflexota bacterium]
MGITQEQKEFFETFGYLVLPGLVKEEIGWIIDEFEAVFRDRGTVHDGTQRSCIVPFIDQRERFCKLLDQPQIVNLITSLIGEDFNYLGGDGNFYTGDTRWHSDGFHTIGKYLKVAFYLDPVTRDSGALRVIPGSHRIDLRDNWDARKARESLALWGIEQSQVPAIALESQPGDVVAFNHNLMHAAFGGSKWRRMFTINACAHAETAEELKELENFIAGSARFWVDHAHSEIMRETASPQRMRFLQQVIEHEGHLPALAAKARAEMAEPARG